MGRETLIKSAKRITKIEKEGPFREAAKQPVILYWGSEPAPGFEELVEQRERAVEQRPGKKKKKRRRR